MTGADWTALGGLGHGRLQFAFPSSLVVDGAIR